MSVLGSITAALEEAEVTGWQADLARSLATAMDATPNAATAKELRALMVDLTGSRAGAKADPSDELAAKRAARRAGTATGS